MEATITLVYEDSKEAKAISEAVSPDNIEVPKSLSVETMCVDNQVVSSVRYDGDNLLTFISTIDDLLSCVSIAEKTFLTLKKLKETTI